MLTIATVTNDFSMFGMNKSFSVLFYSEKKRCRYLYSQKPHLKQDLFDIIIQIVITKKLYLNGTLD